MKKSFINNALLLVSAQYVSILHKINNGEDDTRHSQVPLAPDSYMSRCLKITEKVSFNIASEASYVYILSGQKFIKNAKIGQFDEFLKI